MSSPTAVPVSKFRELSLTRMPPTTRSQAQRQVPQQQDDEDSSEYHDSSSESESESGSSSDDAMSEDDDDDNGEGDEPDVVTSPSKLSYRLDRLSPEDRKRVRKTFKKPPQLSLKLCLLHDNHYGATDSRDGLPCKHLIWLLDQVVKQTLYDHDPSSPLTMTPGGFPEEIGDPYNDISAFHSDVLADGLHVFNPDFGTGDDSDDSDASDESDESDSSEEGDTSRPLDRPIPHRIQEVREMLSAISSSAPEDFRPDLLSSPTSSSRRSKKSPIKRRDLEATVFRMLLANDEFFHYFLSQMRSTDPVNDPFRKLSQRVDRVLHELDAFAAGDPSRPASAEGPRDVAWAARHITGVVGLITRERPLEPWERSSAARALVRILAGVVERNRDFVPPGLRTAASSVPRQDRNLFLRLVGDRDEGFVLNVLDLLPPDAAAPFLHTLEAIQDQLGVHGAPASYVEKFRSLMSRLRRRASVASSSTPATGSKRQSQGPDRGSKRVK
uniref:Swim zinc finger family protein n=1 Tax=Colletotrichum fructicola (strain Nara gc5) TaxID=1213859 RepID=L2G0C4_COLFN